MFKKDLFFLLKKYMYIFEYSRMLGFEREKEKQNYICYKVYFITKSNQWAVLYSTGILKITTSYISFFDEKGYCSIRKVINTQKLLPYKGRFFMNFEDLYNENKT